MNESDMAKRIADLEEELAHTRQHRDTLIRNIQQYVPIVPDLVKIVSPKEMVGIISAFPELTISDIVDEFKNRPR